MEDGDRMETDADGMETDPPGPGGAPAPPGDVPRAGRAVPSAKAIRDELCRAVAELSLRELASSAQWAAELSVALPDEEDEDEDVGPPLGPGCGGGGSAKTHRSLMLAKAHFGMREYGRAAHALSHIPDLHRTQAALFLRYYALYLAGEKRREEEASEVADHAEKCQVRNRELKAIQEQLGRLHQQGLLDGLSLYLYGVVLRGVELRAEARAVLLESVRAFPCNWSAWLDLIAVSQDLSDAALSQLELSLPDHWMAGFFVAALRAEVQRSEEARELYDALRQHFPGSSYILSQTALCYYNMRNFDSSQAVFDELRKQDPYRLASLDTYSNILYVKEEPAALSHLARQAVKIDKYTPEACCIIGNYYSLKCEHERSVIYFQRALCLNRDFTPAWILMGHEFMEMKNTPAAIDAYRTAVSINQRDYRAWYGLGQTYELLNLHFYALYYYRRAMALRPEDARMWCAMAQCYEAMDRKAEALKCYEKAHRCGDRERVALPRLARLLAERGDRARAAACYEQIAAQHSAPSAGLPGAASGGIPTDVVEALRFLMQFYREEGRLDDCEVCAARLLDTAGPEKDEAKAVLRDLRADDGAFAGRGFGIFQPLLGAD